MGFGELFGPLALENYADPHAGGGGGEGGMNKSAKHHTLTD